MPDPKRIGISGQARGIDPQRQRRNSFTTDEAVAAPLTLNQRGQITIQVSGPFQVDAEGNLGLNVAPPLTVTNNSPLTLGLALDPSLTVINGKLAPALVQSDNQRAGLAPRLTGTSTNFLAGDGVYRDLPVGDHGALTGLADDDHTQYVLADGTRAGWPVPAVFTSTDDGLAPASGGGTTNFLRADGTWAAPSGGGGGSGLDQPAVMARMAFGGF